MGPHVWVLLLALAGLSLLAYALRALDLAGAIASFVLGLVIGGLGGLGWLVLMACFTGLGILATRIGYRQKTRARLEEAAGGERSVANVLGNGLAPGLVAVMMLLPVDELAVRLAFASAVAAVAADTVASEIGVLSQKARLVLPPFRPARPGVNGAVSLLGQLAALLASCGIGLVAVWLVKFPLEWFWVPAIAGFLGCQIDSVLGATLEREPAEAGKLGKQEVNFLAGAVPAAVVLVVVLMRGG